LTGKDSFGHNNHMARPPKDKRLLMNVYLRIPLTADQKRLVEEAARLDFSDVTPWVRALLVRAASERVAPERATRSARKLPQP
jgi:hypothetical protein